MNEQKIIYLKDGRIIYCIDIWKFKLDGYIRCDIYTHIGIVGLYDKWMSYKIKFNLSFKHTQKDFDFYCVEFQKYLINNGY